MGNSTPLSKPRSCQNWLHRSSLPIVEAAVGPEDFQVAATAPTVDNLEILATMAVSGVPAIIGTNEMQS